jgi:TolB protein
MVVSRPQLAVLAGACALLIGASSASASFPGRAGKIAFVSDASGSSDILVMNADGSGRESLTSGTTEDIDPAWSPEGSRLVFVRDGAIHVIKSDGSGLRRITAGTTPAWSPDGQRIVFSRRVGRGADLYLVRADGRGLTRLTRTVAIESDPEWSPDGRLIAFARAGVAGDAQLYLLRPNGRGLRRVTTGPLGDSSPTWSPDSRQLAFVRNDESLGSSRVFVTTVDGKRLRPLVGELQLDPAANFEGGPAWSPDGKRIVFVRGARLYSDLYVASTDGRFLRRVTNNAVDQVTDRQPSWQRLALRKRPPSGL